MTAMRTRGRLARSSFMVEVLRICNNIKNKFKKRIIKTTNNYENYRFHSYFKKIYIYTQLTPNKKKRRKAIPFSRWEINFDYVTMSSWPLSYKLLLTIIWRVSSAKSRWDKRTRRLVGELRFHSLLLTARFMTSAS